MAKATNRNAAAKKAPAKKTASKTAAVKSTPKKATSKQASPKKAAAVANLKKANAAKKAAPVKSVAPKKAAQRPSQSAAPKKATANAVQLEDLFLDSLKDIYWAEKALTKALPKLARAATSGDLRSAFEDHLAATEGHVQRLESVFESIGQRAQAKKCEAMAGLTKEADEMTSSTKKGTETRDVALIMAAQKVEHYEIATYGSLATLAAQLGYSEAKELLGQTLQEEKDTDALLTEIAESHVNEEAGSEGEDEGDEDTNSEDDTDGEGDDDTEDETEESKKG